MTRRSEYGYSKDRSKASGPSSLNFQLDYSDYDRSLRKARQDTQRLSKEIRSVARFINSKGGKSAQFRIMEGDLNMFASQVSRRVLPAGTVEMQVQQRKQ